MKKVFLWLIKFYQSIPLPNSCRFMPTCSQYTYQAVKKYGALKGSWIGLKRIARCHPWGKGGPDPLY